MILNTEELMHPLQFWLEWDTHSTHLTWSISSIHRPTDHPKQNTKVSLGYAAKRFVRITLYSNITWSITLLSYYTTQVLPYTSSSPTIGINSKSAARTQKIYSLYSVKSGHNNILHTLANMLTRHGTQSYVLQAAVNFKIYIFLLLFTS